LDALRNLKHLQLNGTKITVDGLSRLSRAHQLEVLTLNDTAITDRAVDALATMRSLKKLCLFNTNLSEAAVNALQSNLPGCQIFYSPKQVRLED